MVCEYPLAAREPLEAFGIHARNERGADPFESVQTFVTFH
jgi:hypothetical protein